jgi:hypothetical protein
MGEQTNLQGKQSKKVKALTALLDKNTKDGRSTQCPKQGNEVEVNWKPQTAPAKDSGAKEKGKHGG